MATKSEQLIPGPYGTKHQELVQRIAEKTRAGKIIWNRTTGGMQANVSGKMSLVFVNAPPFPPSSYRWTLFVVKGDQGNEILKVVPGAPSFISILAGGDPLVREVNKLYAFVEEKAEGDVERAINLLDRI